MIKGILTIIFVVISGFSSASTLIYSLENILRYAGQVGELKINDLGELKDFQELNCGYAHTFESEELIVDENKVWSSHQLSISQSYYVLSFDAEYEIRNIKERLSLASADVQEELRQDIKDCIEYIKSFEIVLLPETTFEIMLNADKQYAQLEYLILNDTGILPKATLGCSFKERILSEQIKLKCLKVMIEDTLRKKHKSIYAQLLQNQ